MKLFAQILGYLGMLLIVISFLFKNVKLLRIFSLSGEVLTIAFAAILLFLDINNPENISSFLPTLILNVALLVINIVMLLTGKFKSENK